MTCVKNVIEKQEQRQQSTRIKKKDIIGKKYNFLTVLETQKENNKYYCICVCNCGKIVKVLKGNLIRNHTKSCGCYNSKLSTERKIKGPNKYIELENTIKIIINQNNKEKYCIIDKEDYPKISQYRWYITNKGYVAYKRNNNEKILLIHRLIMQPEEGKVVDHINGDPLDNRKENLRICTQNDNSHNSKKHKNNTTGYKGVSKVKNKFLVQIKTKDLFIRKLFDNKIDAAEFYDKETLKLYGKYAKLNFEEKRKLYLKELESAH